MKTIITLLLVFVFSLSGMGQIAQSSQQKLKISEALKEIQQ